MPLIAEIINTAGGLTGKAEATLDCRKFAE